MIRPMGQKKINHFWPFLTVFAKILVYCITSYTCPDVSVLKRRKKLAIYDQTSPPSAREAAMSVMQYETFLKHLESFLETSMKHSRNTLENHETPLKHPQYFLFSEIFEKHPWNFLQKPLKLPQITLQFSL